MRSRRSAAEGGRLRQPQGLLHERLLLREVHLEPPRSRRRRLGATDVARDSAVRVDVAVQETVADVAPGPHVARLFLTPDELGARRLARERRGQLGPRKGIEALQTD